MRQAKTSGTRLREVTGKPVDRILGSFVDRAGAPVLSVQSRCVAGKTTDVDLTMGRFIGVPGSPREEQTWTLPACLKTASGQPRCEVIERPTQTVQLNGCSKTEGDAVFANTDSRGYYFTEYSPDAARALARSATTLKPIERLSLLGDEWWMVRGGRHDVGVYLDVASAFASDTTSAVIEMLAGRLAVIGQDLVTASDQARYQAWIRTQFGPQLRALSLPGEAKDNDETHMRRATLLELVGVTGNDPEVQKRSRELAEQYLKDSRALPATMAATVLKVAALGGDRALYDQYVAKLGTLAAQPEQYLPILQCALVVQGPGAIETHPRVCALPCCSHAGYRHA